jgi:hypothetical protein
VPRLPPEEPRHAGPEAAVPIYLTADAPFPAP